LNTSVHDDATRLEKMSNEEQQRSGRHDTLGEMSDVEQQRSRSAVDLRKSFIKCRSTSTTELNSTSSDNVLSSFQKRTRAELSRWPAAFKSYAPKFPRLPVGFKPRAQAELFVVVRSVDYSFASIRKASAQAACSKLDYNQHTGWLHKSNKNDINQYNTSQE